MATVVDKAKGMKMSKNNNETYYTKEELLNKSPEELVQLIESLIDEVESLRFMLDEFYNAEKSIGKNIETEFKRILLENFVVEGGEQGEA